MNEKDERLISNIDKLLKLHQEHPDLPIIPMVNGEVVADDTHSYWKGEWGRCEKTFIYQGREAIHFADDDLVDVLMDIAGCRYGYDEHGRDVEEFDEAEAMEVYHALPWVECIVVYITL